MATVLLHHSLSDIREFFGSSSIAWNLDAIPLWIEELGKGADNSDKALLAIISQMLSEHPEDRPTARAVFEEIVSIESHEPFCGACCDPGTAIQPAHSHTTIMEESHKNMQSLRAVLEPSVAVPAEADPNTVNEEHIPNSRENNNSTKGSFKNDTEHTLQSHRNVQNEAISPISEAPPAYETLIPDHARDDRVPYTGSTPVPSLSWSTEDP
jgi:hypothetical protein